MSEPLNIFDKFRLAASSWIMNRTRNYTTSPGRGAAQDTYLLPRSLLKKVFLEAGYLEGTPGDYGLVKKAVGGRNIPVFQTKEDTISRDRLIPIGNPDTTEQHEYPIPDDAQLYHAGYFPTALYIDSNYNVYRKDWDLNDYGNSTGRAGTLYKDLLWLANLLDVVGSPVVVTTGFLPVLNHGNKVSLFDIYESSPIAQKFIKDQGLVPYYEDIPISFGPEVDKMWEENRWERPTRKKLTMFTLPEVVVTAEKKLKNDLSRNTYKSETRKAN